MLGMIRLLARLILSILSDAIGLAAAAIILEGFTINGVAFIVAVLIFSVSTTVLGPFIAKIAVKNASYLMGGIALITTFVGLVITNLISSGISIQGLSTWFLATFIIWIFAIIGHILLPLIIFRKTLQKAKSE